MVCEPQYGNFNPLLSQYVMEGGLNLVVCPGSLVAIAMPMVEMVEMEEMEEILLIKASTQMAHRSLPEIWCLTFYGSDFF